MLRSGTTLNYQRKMASTLSQDYVNNATLSEIIIKYCILRWSPGRLWTTNEKLVSNHYYADNAILSRKKINYRTYYRTSEKI